MPPVLEDLNDWREFRVLMMLHFKRIGADQIVRGEEDMLPDLPEGSDKASLEKRRKAQEKWREERAASHLDLIKCLAGTLRSVALEADNVVTPW